MILPAHGNDILAVEVTNISSHGVWLLAHDKELFMSYEDFPWFKNQIFQSILNVEEQSSGITTGLILTLI